MNSPALAFATIYWTGEQLSRADSLTEALPLDRFRAEMMGVNWGVPADFLHYGLTSDFQESHAIALLHDVLVRPQLIEEVDFSSTIWKLGDDFDRKGARFLPYWNNSEYVQIDPPDCYVSLYQHPKNGVLAIVSNVGKGDVQVSVTLNLEKLGHPAQGLTAGDGLTSKPVVLEANTVKVALPSAGWQYIWIRPTQR